MSKTVRNAFLESSKAVDPSWSATMPAAQEFLLRNDGQTGDPQDREFELFNVPFPAESGGNLPSTRPGIDRELILHVERLSCPNHAFVETTNNMEFDDPGDRIDNEDPEANGGDQDTEYLESPRYLDIDSIRLVVRNRELDINATPTPILVGASHQDIKNVENTRRISGSLATDFWRMNSATPLNTGRLSAADGSPSTNKPNLAFITSTGSPTPSPAAMPWPNRPFFSPAELLLVPNDRPTTFLRNYDTRLVGGSTDLPNNLLLEAVTVPTYFAGVHDSWNDTSNNLRTQTGIDRRITPVNQLSAYREPGRVNVNTVTSPQVWDAVVAGPFPVEDLDNDGHLDSQEDNNNNQQLDPGEDDDDDKRLDVPEDIPPDYKTDSPSEDGQDNRTVRAFDSSASPTKTVKDVLSFAGSANSPTMYDTKATYRQVVDVELNPQHKIYTASRLANTATVRSNVFAVWVTLRESISGDPDSVKYHRAFYIIDRSIPVGFEDGEDHNVKNTIRLRRIIE